MDKTYVFHLMESRCKFVTVVKWLTLWHQMLYISDAQCDAQNASI